MSYEKPELLVLSVASNAVRTSNDGTNTLEADGKISNSTESNRTDSPGDLGVTSSSGSAYEADE